MTQATLSADAPLHERARCEILTADARVSGILAEETERIRAAVGEETWQAGRPTETRALFEQLVLTDTFPDFLTLPAYELID